jgi:hypothetical protein
MRLVFGGFLIASGLALAMVELEGTHTRVSQVESQPTTLSPSTSTVQLNAPMTIVTLPVRSRPPEAFVANVMPNAPIAGADLVSELQRELTRVECYDGPVDGHWNAHTRRAMAAFLDGANAKLPTDHADGVLLALVKHPSGAACGSCPTGQQASTDGRCVPEAIAARTAILQPLAKPSRHAEQSAGRTRRSAKIEGRMGVGGPTLVDKLTNQLPRAAEAQPPPSDEPPVVRPRRQKRAARHAKGRVAGLSRRYVRAMRAPRYAHRSRGIVALLFGWF